MLGCGVWECMAGLGGAEVGVGGKAGSLPSADGRSGQVQSRHQELAQFSQTRLMTFLAPLRVSPSLGGAVGRGVLDVLSQAPRTKEEAGSGAGRGDPYTHRHRPSGRFPVGQNCRLCAHLCTCVRGRGVGSSSARAGPGTCRGMDRCLGPRGLAPALLP